MFFEPFQNLPTNQPAETQIELPWRLCDSHNYDMVRRFMVLSCNVTRHIRVFFIYSLFETEVRFA